VSGFCLKPIEQFSAISWQVIFWWDDDDVRFVLAEYSN